MYCPKIGLTLLDCSLTSPTKAECNEKFPSQPLSSISQTKPSLCLAQLLWLLRLVFLLSSLFHFSGSATRFH